MAHEKEYDDILADLRKENQELRELNASLSKAYENLKEKVNILRY